VPLITSLADCLAHDMMILPSASLISRAAFEAVGGCDQRLCGYEEDVHQGGALAVALQFDVHLVQPAHDQVADDLCAQPVGGVPRPNRRPASCGTPL
jgi:hypothetical protein